MRTYDINGNELNENADTHAAIQYSLLADYSIKYLLSNIWVIPLRQSYYAIRNELDVGRQAGYRCLDWQLQLSGTKVAASCKFVTNCKAETTT